MFGVCFFYVKNYEQRIFNKNKEFFLVIVNFYLWIFKKNSLRDIFVIEYFSSPLTRANTDP